MIQYEKASVILAYIGKCFGFGNILFRNQFHLEMIKTNISYTTNRSVLSAIRSLCGCMAADGTPERQNILIL